MTAAADSFVGDGLNPSPYKEALNRIRELEAERDALRADAERLREADELLNKAAHAISGLIGAYTDAREVITGRRTDTPALAEAKATLDRLMDAALKGRRT